jgi:glycosyltransferase involved in cell wall biosynthesis
MNKIALCVNSFFPLVGGCELVTKNIADYFSKNNEVVVFTRYSSKRKTNRIDNISIEHYDNTNPSSFITKYKKFNPDYTMIYSDVFDFFHQVLDCGKNICLVPCGGNRLCTKPYSLKMFLNKISSVKSLVCHTERERDYKLLKELNLLNKTFIIPIGIDIEEFDIESERKDIISEKTNDFWILNVANFFPGKGQLYMFNILTDLVNNYDLKDKITYIQICTSLDFSIGKQLEEQWKIKMRGLKGVQTILLKDKPRSTVVSVFKNSNVFVSTSERESAGVVFLESMAAKCPWVSSNVGIVPELNGGYGVTSIKDKNHNIIFNSKVFEIYAKKISICLKDNKIGEEGRKQVEQTYQLKNIMPLYEKVFW